MDRASIRSLRRRIKRQEASKLVSSHLCIFMSKEWKAEKEEV